MNEKEFNGLILAELVKIANDVFTNEIEIAPGTYTAAELAKLKDANGNEINIKYLCVDAKLNITDFRTVQINSFKCSFPVDQVFNLVWQFEKLIGTKQANKTRFTKIEERENIVCSFDMWITKEHLNITKLVTKDSLRPAFNYIYLDPYKSALVASDGRTLKEYPVIIETSGLLPDGLKLFINPKHLKEMVGRCSVCVCSQEGGNITEITNDKKQAFICDFAGYFPNYRLVYPNLSKDGFIKIQKSELKAVAGFVKEIAKRNKKSGFSLRTIARENKVYLSYNDADSNGHKELCVTLEKAALIDIKLGFFASNVIPLLSGWTGGVWLVAPDRAAVFDDKAARIGVVMPAFINDSICPNLKCNIKALDRAKVPTIPEKESVREPEKHLPALYVDVQTKTPAFVFALVALIDFISRWFYQDQINKALQRLTMLTELSGISLPELLTEPVNEETNANEPEPITENEPVRAYTPELLYIDQPLVFPVPIFIHKHERTISPTVVPELLNRQCITLLFVSMMLPELLRRYVWGAIRPKANADELFWGDFRRFHTKGNHRIRDGTKEANKPKLQPFQTNYYIHQESLWKRINKPKEVIAETNRLRKVRSMLLDWILIWLILSESNRT
ncbi:hypothetical protein Q4463_12145 [Bacteroides caccae]|uniref:Uncharacterized protein n=1 Tax=Bacteroides caccae TaxID=47678 RepID=A0AAW7WR54_9BACE|nr:hypothetical protein [Bacteroides caccae]MDO6328480.1 hypothetical protein [Bacteroides caccae]MDO6339539.1 hypothetical protein [Bacteroides caccae]MDO6358375.1 hypothetical protein [Bacteroides caccae]